MGTHIRARCRTTGHIAALPAHAFRLGAFPDWEAVDGPVPKRPKPSVARRRRKQADEQSARTSEE